MRQIHAPAATAFALLLAACAALGDETHREFRSLTIVNGHFDPPEIGAPAGTPVTLVVALFGWRDATISIPALGIGAVRIPANRFNPHSTKNTAAGNTETARIVLGPLDPGEYQIICECSGGTEVARLVVDRT
jgi:hypothetical protein